MVLKKTVLAKCLLSCIFLMLFLGSFEFYQEFKVHYLFFVFVVSTLLFVDKKQKLLTVLVSCALFLFNLLSQISGFTYIGIFNLSWFLQISLYSVLIITLPFVIRQYPFEFHVRLARILLYINSAFMLLSFFLIVSGVGLGFELISIGDSYNRLYMVTSKLGLMKFIIPLTSLSVYILFKQYLDKRIKRLTIISFVLFMVTIQVKTVLLGCSLILGIWLIRKIRFKQLKVAFFLLILFLLIFILYIYIDLISQFGVYNGRYIFPILLSYDFYNYPFGFGFGNYSEVMKGMFITLNYSGELNETLVNVLELGYGEAFHTSESDILQLGVSFGFTFLFLYFTMLIVLSGSLVINRYFDYGICALLFIFFCGFYQDYTQSNVYWLLVIYVFTLYSTFLNKFKVCNNA